MRDDKRKDKADPVVTSEGEEKILRVSGGTDCHKLASAIAGVIERKEGRCVIEYLGAGAGNQAVKGVIIANNILASTGFYVSIVPSFCKRPMPDNAEAVAVQLRTILHRT